MTSSLLTCLKSMYSISLSIILLLSSKRFKQILHSSSDYLFEISQCRSPFDFYMWLYFKFPYAFTVRDYPTNILIAITNQCNLSCRHCFRNVLKQSNDNMDLLLFKKIIDELILHPEINLILCGAAEPAFHPDFRDFGKLLSRTKIKYYLHTNGLLFTRFSPEEILGWKIDELVISVDGLDAKSYEYIRKGASYNILRSQITEFYQARKKLKRNFPKIEIRHVIFPYERHIDLLQFKKDWLRVSDTVKFNHLIPLSPRAQFPKISKSFSKCRDIRRTIYIGPEGNVPLCGYHSLQGAAELIGNIYLNSILEVWKNPRLCEVRKYHERGQLERIPFCKTCYQRS